MSTTDGPRHRGAPRSDPRDDDRRLDAALRLLDRQILDSEEMAVGKVDDAELALLHDSGDLSRLADLHVIRLLTGAAAWLPRLARPLAEQWRLLAPAEPERENPWSIGLDLIDTIRTDVRLTRPREGLLRRTEAPYRLSRLLGMPVVDADGRHHGFLTEVALDRAQDLVITRAVVGHRHPGGMLGYHQHPEAGPWLVRRLVRVWARHNREFDAADLRIDWEAGQVRITSEATGTPTGE